MAGFNFDTGGRRCIRPILEKYQAGKWSIIFYLQNEPQEMKQTKKSHEFIAYE